MHATHPNEENRQHSGCPFAQVASSSGYRLERLEAELSELKRAVRALSAARRRAAPVVHPAAGARSADLKRLLLEELGRARLPLGTRDLARVLTRSMAGDAARVALALNELEAEGLVVSTQARVNRTEWELRPQSTDVDGTGGGRP